MPHSSFGQGLWRLADPKISLASLAALLLGSAAAARAGPIHWGWLAVTVLGIFAIEVAKNASGEVVDFARGVDQAVAAEDRSPFSGGKRVLVDTLLTRGQTIGIAVVGYLLGIAVGLLIVWQREPGVLWISVAGIALAFFYHAPPLRLSYRGLGELAVAVAYGPLICAGAFLVQRGTVATEVFWLSLPLALLIAAFLWINEFPDYLADKAAGKRTLVVRLGKQRASQGFAAIVAMASLLIVLIPFATAPRGALLGAVSIVPAASAARTLLAAPERTAQVIPAQVRTLQAFVLYAVAASLGLLMF